LAFWWASAFAAATAAAAVAAAAAATVAAAAAVAVAAAAGTIAGTATVAGTATIAGSTTAAAGWVRDALWEWVCGYSEVLQLVSLSASVGVAPKVWCGEDWTSGLGTEVALLLPWVTTWLWSWALAFWQTGGWAWSLYVWEYWWTWDMDWWGST